MGTARFSTVEFRVTDVAAHERRGRMEDVVEAIVDETLAF